LKLHYKDPTLWGMLSRIYKDDPSKAAASAAKSLKYGTGLPRVAGRLIASGQFLKVLLNCEFNLS